ncbi:hypothetical protein CPB83DRAFT_891851 [Crepidotus variabilis]|uniref:Uncharacterized protein n=1 Tax=Crepidotus variabilis TaxID=179855 RepID=A0A9P6JSM8_9AGAR|nr:hypothetical protein CPB83DRAFT_891851 [Crepidotus variabilis]
MAFSSSDEDSIVNGMNSLSVDRHRSDIFVKVEDMTYPFPEDHFRRCNFQFVVEPGTNGNGTSQENPIILRAGLVSADDLDAVLEVFGLGISDHADDLINLSASKWFAALKLANLWQYEGLRRGALSYLRNKDEFQDDTINRIFYGIDVWDKSWVIEGCNYLVERAVRADSPVANQLGTTMYGVMIALYDVRGNLLINTGINLDANIKAILDIFVQGLSM